jgi:hypothetical protein
MYGFTARRTAGALLAGGALVAVAACGPLGSSASGEKNGTDGTGAKAAASPSATGGDSALSGAAHAVQALDLVKKAASGVHSAKVESTVSIGTTMSIDYKGAIDWGTGMRGEMTATYTGGAVAEQLKDAGLPPSMVGRYLPDAYYVNMGDAMAAQLGGKHWIKYTYDDFAKLTGGAGSFLKDAVKNNDPVKSVDAALAAPDTANLGADTVRGVPATHYRATLTAQELTGKAAGNLTAADRQALKETLDKSGITTETIDLWVSKDNLPVETSVTATATSGATPGVIKTQTFYSDFGVAVSVKAPSAFDTTDFADLLKQGQQSS